MPEGAKMKRSKPVFDYESYVARRNLEESSELDWQNDASYFWAALVRVKRRAMLRKKRRLEEHKNGQTTSP
jgi:hypothetical protein